MRGFEPPTSCSRSRRATRLRYTPLGSNPECVPETSREALDGRTIGQESEGQNQGLVPVVEKWSGGEDSNLRPTVPKTVALPGCATPREKQAVRAAPTRRARANGGASLNHTLFNERRVAPTRTCSAETGRIGHSRHGEIQGCGVPDRGGFPDWHRNAVSRSSPCRWGRTTGIPAQEWPNCQTARPWWACRFGVGKRHRTGWWKQGKRLAFRG